MIYKSHYYFRYRVQIDRVQAADPRKINLEAMVSIGLLGKLAPPLGITKKIQYPRTVFPQRSWYLICTLTITSIK